MMKEKCISYTTTYWMKNVMCYSQLTFIISFSLCFDQSDWTLIFIFSESYRIVLCRNWEIVSHLLGGKMWVKLLHVFLKLLIWRFWGNKCRFLMNNVWLHFPIWPELSCWLTISLFTIFSLLQSENKWNKRFLKES